MDKIKEKIVLMILLKVNSKKRRKINQKMVLISFAFLKFCKD